MSLKASISGIRGVVGESLTPSLIVDYVSAYSAIVPDGDIIIGMDSRPTGSMIKDLVVSTLNACGRNTVNVGIVPTPTVLFLVKTQKAAGGIVITASHNPLQWNALKLVNSQGKFLSPAEFEKLSTIYDSKKFSFAPYNKIGSNKDNPDLQALHIKKILESVDVKLISGRNFKVAVDTVNGAAGPMALELLSLLNCRVAQINCEPTGLFAHEPEPTPVNLKDLSSLVAKERADVGFAFDPDGDRLVVASDNGNILTEELTLALAADHLLGMGLDSDLVVNLSSSKVTEDIAKKYGKKIYRAPTGEINVTELMEKVGATLGGEGNGGVIYRKVNTCRDALIGMALILEYMAKKSEPIEKLQSSLPAYTLVKQKYSINNLNYDDIKGKVAAAFKEGVVNEEDGLRIDFEDSWLLLRKSNTEPIIRVFAEALTTEKAMSIIEKAKAAGGIN